MNKKCAQNFMFSLFTRFNAASFLVGLYDVCCMLIVSTEETESYFCTLFHIHATNFNGLNQPNILKIHLN